MRFVAQCRARGVGVFFQPDVGETDGGFGRQQSEIVPRGDLRGDRVGVIVAGQPDRARFFVVFGMAVADDAVDIGFVRFVFAVHEPRVRIDVGFRAVGRNVAGGIGVTDTGLEAVGEVDFGAGRESV